MVVFLKRDVNLENHIVIKDNDNHSALADLTGESAIIMSNEYRNT